VEQDVYKRLANRLDALPNGFPTTEDGVELELLAQLFSPEEAQCASQLRLTPETPAQLAARIGKDSQAVRALLKSMAKKGLIEVHRLENGLGYALMPFVVGFYERQIERLDGELARLMESYFRQAFKIVLPVEPQFHRVIPIDEAIPVDIEVHPFESAAAIINRAQAWGVIDCICRKQKALIGEACSHPIEMCMIFSNTPGAFDHSPSVKALTREESLKTLRQAAEAGLVHTIGNHRDHESYICNCCTCSCGILRGVAELGVANVVARSAFISQVDLTACIGCEDCINFCQFDALTLVDGAVEVNRRRCVGCGQCVMHCTQEALTLVRRPEEEIKPIPATMLDWQNERSSARGKDVNEVR
jgi:Pyruvate/2-oxoacid:ferredoxin oxidoreductase delta subunit